RRHNIVATVMATDKDSIGDCSCVVFCDSIRRLHVDFFSTTLIRSSFSYLLYTQHPITRSSRFVSKLREKGLILLSFFKKSRNFLKNCWFHPIKGAFIML